MKEKFKVYELKRSYQIKKINRCHKYKISIVKERISKLKHSTDKVTWNTNRDIKNINKK